MNKNLVRFSNYFTENNTNNQKKHQTNNCILKCEIKKNCITTIVIEDFCSNARS